MWKVFSVVVLGVVLNTSALAQVAKSPLTALGIGEVRDLSMVHNDGMGGIGISTGSLWYMNTMNPALLPFNSLTVFGAGFATERRTIETVDDNSVSSGGNISYLGTALPIINGRWTTSVGLAPYSTVNYSISEIKEFPEGSGEVGFLNEGSGGFNQFYWSNGVRIGSDFYLGVRGTYLFSSIREQSQSQVVDSDSTVFTYIIALNDRLSVSDIIWTAGAAFSKDSIFNKNIRLTVGATYDFASNVNANLFRTLERRNNLNIPVQADTLMDSDGNIFLPSAYGFGFTFSEGLNWQASLEVQMQGWSDYKRFEGGNDNMTDAMRVILGGEITPDYTSVTNYFKRVSYRGGISYARLPYLINNNQVKEIGINFGLSLPVSRFSSIDFAVNYANRGNIEETVLKEEVWRFGLGITFNDQWFIRRKYD
ncbi:MAG: hypothetical protein ACNS60_20930 [Candidatus Cyclobacteriaceae bacterium M2_1C_046]